MKKLIVTIVLSAMIITPHILSAEDNAAFPLSLKAAIDLNYLSYMETGTDGEAIDGDTGWLGDFFLKAVTTVKRSSRVFHFQ